MPVRQSAAYRIKKFVRRHTVGVAASLGLVVLLAMGIAGTVAGLVAARRAEARAVQDAEAARQVSDFLVDLFRVSDPGEARGDTVTAREILDRGVERIASLDDQPLVQSRLQLTMARVYEELGMYTQGIELVEEALVTRGERLGEPHELVAECLDHLAVLYENWGKYDLAEPLFEQSLAIQEERPDAELDKLDTLVNLAILQAKRGRVAEAKACFDAP